MSPLYMTRAPDCPYGTDAWELVIVGWHPAYGTPVPSEREVQEAVDFVYAGEETIRRVAANGERGAQLAEIAWPRES